MENFWPPFKTGVEKKTGVVKLVAVILKDKTKTKSLEPMAKDRACPQLSPLALAQRC